MNCKQGDLAIQVRSAANNHGSLYTVLRWIGEYRFRSGVTHTDCWMCRAEQRIIARYGTVYEQGSEVRVPDSHLRPIRPGDISDEEVRDLYLPKVPEAA